jgi:hypothetical protein
VLQNDLAPGTDHTGAAGRGLAAVNVTTGRGAERGTGNYIFFDFKVLSMTFFTNLKILCWVSERALEEQRTRI